MDELIHKGHRQRMRRKFTDFGSLVFDTYELLEMLLYYTVPVKDTNPISKRLLQRFGSLDGVLSADKDALREVEGVGERTAELIFNVGMALDLFNHENENAEVTSEFENYDYIGRYVSEYLGTRMESAQLLLSFDNDMHLLGVDEIYNCDYASAAVKSDKFMDAALKRGATVAIVAHNHPYGPLCPTEGDRATNVMIQTSLSNVGVFLAEHYVVCGARYVGFMNHLECMFAGRPRVARFLRSKREVVNGT